MMARLSLVLGVEVKAGNEHTGSLPYLVRGKIDPAPFKLRNPLTKTKVKGPGSN